MLKDAARRDQLTPEKRIAEALESIAETLLYFRERDEKRDRPPASPTERTPTAEPRREPTQPT